MFEESIELETVEAAPGTVEVLPGLRLLPRVVVVQELVNYPRYLPMIRTLRSRVEVVLVLIMFQLQIHERCH